MALTMEVEEAEVRCLALGVLPCPRVPFTSRYCHGKRIT